MNLAAGLAVIVVLQGAAMVSPYGPFGVWKTPVDEGLIRIERCGEDLCGRIAGSAPLTAHPDLTDGRNHDPALRARPIMGLLVLQLKPLGPDRWGDGWIYDPRNGGTYSARLEMAPNGDVRLTGCLAPLLCRTQTWIRAA